MAVKLTIETEREEDGRWIAEVLEIPGALAYGATLEEAVREAKAIAFAVLGDRAHRENIDSVEFATA
jgi:predicted RNase H-like HicB family nuclease